MPQPLRDSMHIGGHHDGDHKLVAHAGNSTALLRGSRWYSYFCKATVTARSTCRRWDALRCRECACMARKPLEIRLHALWHCTVAIGAGLGS